MVEDRELLLLMVTSATLAIAFWQTERLSAIPQHRTLLLALALLDVGYAATVLEGLFAPPLAEATNVIEHAGYLGHTALLALWCWRQRRPAEELPP